MSLHEIDTILCNYIPTISTLILLIFSLFDKATNDFVSSIWKKKKN